MPGKTSLLFTTIPTFGVRLIDFSTDWALFRRLFLITLNAKLCPQDMPSRRYCTVLATV